MIIDQGFKKTQTSVTSVPKKRIPRAVVIHYYTWYSFFHNGQHIFLHIYMEVRAEMPWQMNFYSAVKRFGQDLTQDLSMQIIKQRLPLLQ